MNKEIIEYATKLGQVLKQRGMMIATAESCTGGGIAQAITEIPGSSAWFDRAFVTYSNNAKIQMLQVKQLTLNAYGAVSKEVAIEMVEGTLNKSNADLVIAITGIAGPDGGSVDKPLGTVFFAWKIQGKISNSLRKQFSGNRTKVRQQTVSYALKLCMELCLERQKSVSQNRSNPQ